MTATAIAHELKEKTCIDCNESWPADKEFFNREAKNKDGLRNTCKACYGATRSFKPRFEGALTTELQSLFSRLVTKQEHATHVNS